VQLGYGGRHLAVGVAVQTREGALCLERKKVLKIIVKKREKTSIFHFSFCSGWILRKQQLKVLALGGNGLLRVTWPNTARE
jgi:hypothetical protein